MYYAGEYKIYCDDYLCGNFIVEKWSERERNSPVILINKTKNVFYKNESVNIFWEYHDDSQVVSGYFYVANPKGKVIYQSYSLGSSVGFGNLPTGKYMINARAKDSANNWGYGSNSFEVI